MTFLFRLGRSPIFSHVNATLQGLTTVHACNASKMLEQEFHAFQDHNTSCTFLANSSSQWFAVSLDVISFLFSTFVTYSFLILPSCKFTFQSKLTLVLTAIFLNTILKCSGSKWANWFGHIELYIFTWALSIWNDCKR